ncbi:MAG: hypothetical protein R3C44_12870 [Chloroflexota bacterium]
MLDVRKAAFLLLMLVLTACSQAKPPESPPEVICPSPPPVDVLTDGWVFTTDPDDIGIVEHWFAPDAERMDWSEATVGRAWEQNGLSYDGIGWYVREISWDGPEAYLFLADADDSATIWVNSVEVATLGADTPSTVLKLDNPDGRSFIAIRVMDEGGFGGLSPPRPSATAIGALDEARLIDYLEAQSPQLPPAPDGRAPDHDRWRRRGGGGVDWGRR